MTSVAVLVADKDTEVTIRTLFTERYQSLGLPWKDILSLGQDHKWWLASQIKPARPKELLDGVIHLSKGKRHHTSAVFSQIAEKISLNHCVDKAFLEMKNWLSYIFSP